MTGNELNGQGGGHPSADGTTASGPSESAAVADKPGNGVVMQPKTEDQLPNSIIVTQVPAEVFTEPDERTKFRALFEGIASESDIVHFDWLRSFKRVRVVFPLPQHAAAAKLIVPTLSFNGHHMKAYLAQRVRLPGQKSTEEGGDTDASTHLGPPPLEKLFLISPPASPPVGWSQTIEMAPVVCSFDLMARLAAFTISDSYEVQHSSGDTPSIVVHPCETTVDSPHGVPMPHTPRPPESLSTTSS